MLIQYDTWQQARENTKMLPDHVMVFANAPTKIVRQNIVRMKNTDACGITHWNRHLGKEISPYLMIADQSTKESSLRLLQFKIFHNIVATNANLHRWKIKDTKQCDFCQEIDTIEHMFSLCSKLRGFWDYVSSWIYCETHTKIKLSTENIILGLLASDFPNVKKTHLHMINHIILIAKFSINKMRFGENKNVFIIFDLEVSYRLNKEYYTQQNN